MINKGDDGEVGSRDKVALSDGEWLSVSIDDGRSVLDIDRKLDGLRGDTASRLDGNRGSVWARDEVDWRESELDGSRDGEGSSEDPVAISKPVDVDEPRRSFREVSKGDLEIPDDKALDDLDGSGDVGDDGRGKETTTNAAGAVCAKEGFIRLADTIIRAGLAAERALAILTKVVSGVAGAGTIETGEDLEAITDAIVVADVGAVRTVEDLRGSASSIDHAVAAVRTEDVFKALADVVGVAGLAIVAGADLLVGTTETISVARRLAIRACTVLKGFTDTVSVASTTVIALCVFTISTVTISSAHAIAVAADEELLKGLAESIAITAETVRASAVLIGLTGAVEVAKVALVGAIEDALKVIASSITIAGHAISAAQEGLVGLAEAVKVADALGTARVLKDIADIIEDARTTVSASLAKVLKRLTEAVVVADTTVRASAVLKVVAETIKVAELAIVAETVLKVLASTVVEAGLAIVGTETDRLRVCADAVLDARATIRDASKVLSEFTELVIVTVAIDTSGTLKVLTDVVGVAIKTLGTVLVLSV